MSASLTAASPPAAAPTVPARGDRAVRLWLSLVALFVFAMVVVGGATRLTESGLSITEWRPLMGAIPPLSAADWAAEFEKYKAIPQYKLLNAGMTLDAFKAIYWWEWAHRLLGRAIGLVFALPFAVFLVTGRLGRRDIAPLGGLFLLGGLQGGLGWWMVASGLSERTDVAPYRLALHLTLACVILALTLAMAEARRAAPRADLGRRARQGANALIGLVLAQIFLGALVAGNDAGLVYNTWPLMNGVVLPSEAFDLAPWWRNLFENHALVQFLHRGGAYLLFVAVLAHGFHIRARAEGEMARLSGLTLVVLVTAQAGLGIVTLLTQVPLPLALGHQALAAIVLGAAVLHRARLA